MVTIFFLNSLAYLMSIACLCRFYGTNIKADKLPKDSHPVFVPCPICSIEEDDGDFRKGLHIKHCELCKKCISGIGHHCPTLGVCMCYKNILRFVQWMSWSIIQGLSLLASIALYRMNWFGRNKS